MACREGLGIPACAPVGVPRSIRSLRGYRRVWRVGGMRSTCPDYVQAAPRLPPVRGQLPCIGRGMERTGALSSVPYTVRGPYQGRSPCVGAVSLRPPSIPSPERMRHARIPGVDRSQIRLSMVPCAIRGASHTPRKAPHGGTPCAGEAFAPPLTHTQRTSPFIPRPVAPRKAFAALWSV